MTRRTSRRNWIAGIGAVATLSLAGCSESTQQMAETTKTSTQTTTQTQTTQTPTPTPSGPQYGDWFSDVPNYDGTTDKTGQSKVTVKVGAEGGLVFAPPAIKVAKGTEVVWDWTGKGGAHNVVHKDGEFSSEIVSGEKHRFSYTFQSLGTHKYYCDPHRSMGMKGAVYVVE